MLHVTWRYIAGAALLVFLLIGGVIGLGLSRSRDLLYVDGMPVCEEEAAFYDGDTERIVRAKVIQSWAREAGIAEKFSYDRFLRSMQVENEERKKLHQEGGQIYGPVEYTPLQYYSRMLGEYESGLRELLLSQTSADTLKAYYEEHIEDYRRVDRIDAKLTVWNGEKVIESDLHLDSYNYRTLSESNEMLVNKLLTLEEGGECLWQEDTGQWLLSCIKRTDGGVEPYEEVAGAVRSQYSQEAFEKELDGRVALCKIRDERPVEKESRQ